ncbi:MAG: hypothetical protein EKK46_12610 [Rhodocyclaceae bacterium]|nr:MAG: hypothetical protein EKK46_12610 [Rhodocyclaceae bacterium]
MLFGIAVEAVEFGISFADILLLPSLVDTVRTAFDQALINAGQTPPPNYIESNSATLTTTLLLHSDMIGVASHRPAFRYGRMKLLSIIPLRLSVFGSTTLYWREDAKSRLAVKTALDGIRQVVREFPSEG